MSIIYTPATVWKNFSVSEEPTFISAGRTEENGFVFENGYVLGRSANGERIKIFIKTVKKGGGKSPAVIVFNDFDIYSDEPLLKKLAESGYLAVMVDIAGSTDKTDNFTVYPEKIAYANLNQSVYSKKEVDDVVKTCWYEWCGVAKYLLAYLKSLSTVTSVGGLGINGGATTLWHLLATEELGCAVFFNNAGWSVYEGKSKFIPATEDGYSDGKVAFVAGVEPQSYATHVKCPTMILSCTNSQRFDLDRAYDTLTRISDGLYKSISYSVNRKTLMDEKTFNNALIFFDKFLCSKKFELPDLIDVDNEEGEQIKVKVDLSKKGLKELLLYVSEGVIEPEKRCWQKISECDLKKEKYEFTFTPNEEYGFTAWFVKAVYKNGYEICSRVCGKLFEKKIDAFKRTNKIIYSSRIDNFETRFGPANEESLLSAVDVEGQINVEKLYGPLKMQGITCKSGVNTFSISAEKVKPERDALIMFDAFVKEGGDITVRLITDYFGQKTVYSATAKVVGEDIWQNVKFSVNSFKTAEGIPLKSYEKVDAIEFYSDKEYLINNALWV